MSRNESTRGFGEGARDPGGWRRHLDPIAWHTVLGLAAGFAISAITGVTLDPYGLRSEEDVEQAFRDGYAYGYAEVADEAFDAGVPVGYVRQLRMQMMRNPDLLLESEYAGAFQQGWTEGWNDAIVAMHASAIEVGLETGAVEFVVLDEMDLR